MFLLSWKVALSLQNFFCPDGDLTFLVSFVQLGNEMVDHSLHVLLHPLQLRGVVKHDGIFYYLVVILMSTPRRQALSRIIMTARNILSVLKLFSPPIISKGSDGAGDILVVHLDHE